MKRNINNSSNSSNSISFSSIRAKLIKLNTILSLLNKAANCKTFNLNYIKRIYLQILQGVEDIWIIIMHLLVIRVVALMLLVSIWKNWERDMAELIVDD